jgi:predicted TPR repeat methyltransferase
VPHQRDIAAFDARAQGYEQGWLGRFHRDLADKTLGIALALAPDARRLLDIGCGTGYSCARLRFASAAPLSSTASTQLRR